MEKVLYVIAHPAGSVPADLTKHLVGPLADELRERGATTVQVTWRITMCPPRAGCG